MPQMIFVNLPVEDLAAARAFYNGLGFPTNPLFTDETTSNAVISETITVMLLTRPCFAQFTPRPVADPQAAVAALYCITRDSREEVDALADRALALGAREERAALDMGFMFNRTFTDPDGHVWELVWMDPQGMPAG